LLLLSKFDELDEAVVLAAKRSLSIEKLEFYISTFFHHLQLDGSNLQLEIYKKESAEMARTVVSYVNSNCRECLKLENYDYKLLFQKVSPQILIQMFNSLLQERKIILVHNDVGRNALIIESLLSLMYPLQWNFTNISYLLPTMVDCLEAPFPFIIGVPRDLWYEIQEHRWDLLGDEIIVFDIDHEKVIMKEELPKFPQPYTQFLTSNLQN